MTFAWYGHLRFKDKAMWVIVLASWLIAFLEYCFLVPANRIGHAYYSAPQLKGMQEIITLIVFAVFSITYLKEDLRWNHYAGFALIICAALLLFFFILLNLYSSCFCSILFLRSLLALTINAINKIRIGIKINIIIPLLFG